MPRVAKERRLKRAARLARKRAWLVEFWGRDWQKNRDRFLLTRPIKPGMLRLMRRAVTMARERAGLGAC